MNFKAVLLIAFFNVYAFSQNEVGEITNFTYAPVLSNIVETSISEDGGNTYYRLSFALQSEISKIKLAKSVEYPDKSYTENIVDQKLLGGLYIVFLDQIPDSPFKETHSFKYISSIVNKDTSQFYIKVDGYDESEFNEYLASNQPFTYKKLNFSFSSLSKVPINYYYPNLNSDISNSLNNRISQYKKFFNDSHEINSKGFVVCTVNNNSFLCAIIQFGNPKISYAMYGIWETDNALNYGYKKYQRIYMSEGVRLAESNFAKRYKINFNADAAYKRKYDFGEICWTYDYIKAHKNETYPYLAWRPYPLNSRSPKKYDKDDNVIPDENGYTPPNSPDGKNNLNPPSLESCPDMDWYWSLFIQCADKTYSTSEDDKISSTEYQSYKDYLDIEMMKDYDQTIYGKDRSVSPLNISTEQQPIAPYVYTKECNLINKDFPKYYDPFDQNTTYSLSYRKTEMRGLEIATHTYNRDVKSLVTPAFNKVIDFYNYLNSGNVIDKLKTFTSSNPVDNDGSGVSYSISEGCDTLPLYIGNKADKNLPYKDARTFLIQDEHYAIDNNPFKVESHSGDWYHGGLDIDFKNLVENQNDQKKWYLTWDWPLMYTDKYGIKREVGKINYRIKFWEEHDKLTPSGKKIDDVKRNEFLSLGGKQVPAEQIANYDSTSKDYYADQYDVGDRDTSIDKSEAIRDIILKISVSEGLDLAMKGLYYAGTKTTYMKPVYEASKRLENSFTQSKSYKLAKNIYKGYVTWKRCMDLAAQLRDEYNKISGAWDGLMYSIDNTWDYYRDFKWNKINLTNCTSLIPASKLSRIDENLYSLQNSIANTGLALYGCAFEADKLTRGNYEPFNSIIKAMTAEMTNSIQTINGQTTDIIQKNTDQLDSLTAKSSGNVSDQAYLSNIIASAHCLITSQQLKVQNENVRNLGTALAIVEGETNSWITYGNIVSNIPSATKKARYESINKKSLMPIVTIYNTEPVFSNVRMNDLRKLAGVK